MRWNDEGREIKKKGSFPQNEITIKFTIYCVVQMDMLIYTLWDQHKTWSRTQPGENTAKCHKIILNNGSHKGPFHIRS